jgi:hypothetical protein
MARIEIEPPNRSDECPVCLEAYFSLRADDKKVTPVELHCNHLCCGPCLVEHFQNSPKCIYPFCTATAEITRLQDDCELCVAWSTSHGSQGATKFAVMVEPKWMLTPLKDYFDDLARSYDECRMSKKNRAYLFDFFKNSLRQFEGHVFEAEDLAEILDPLLNVVDREAWLHSSFGRQVTQPTPATLPTLPVNARNATLYPNAEEPWVTTVLRVWSHDRLEEEGKEMALDFDGYLTQRQVRQGITEFEWPIKRILDHRVNADGGIDYFVQWLGYTLPRFDSWVSRDEISVEAHEDYDAEHDL